jgi:acyl-[acyl-carrier-protein]-phospholipid O-acyltransferase/long-chain-fatty-acid--[acyl-carrier-protein] ligase
MLHHEFVKTAKKAGNKLAFVDRTTDKRMSYSQMLIASLILADKLKRYDKGYLGVLLPTSAGCALITLAALMSGRVPVMINYSTGAARNAVFAQGKCGFTTIITSKALLEKIDCPNVKGMIFLEDLIDDISPADKLIAVGKSKLPLRLLLPLLGSAQVQDDAVILFTSGSERDPRAVQLSHRNIESNIAAFSKLVHLTRDDVILASLPFFHVFGLTINLWTPLVLGMTAVAYANPLDYRTICTIIRDERPTIMAATPAFLAGYLKKSEPGDFASLRLVVSGADRCPESLREGFLHKHNIPLIEGYGATETSPVVSANCHEQNRPGSVGKPIEGVSVKIEHYETGRPCTTGEVGRIMVKGDLVMKGYLDDYEETSMRIRSGWYDTGDLGYLDADGFLWISGRLRRFVKIGGEMVSLVQIEFALEQLLPDGIVCCVVDVPDPKKGARIVAALTDSIDEKQILRELAKHLPPIAMPKEFIVLQEMPKMGSGKIDFRGVGEVVAILHAEKN